MPKSMITFVCTECGGESLRWAGQCPHCHAWNTLQEFQVRKAAAGKAAAPARKPGDSRPAALGEISSDAAPARALAWDQLNPPLLGGIVPPTLATSPRHPDLSTS